MANRRAKRPGIGTNWFVSEITCNRKTQPVVAGLFELSVTGVAGLLSYRKLTLVNINRCSCRSTTTLTGTTGVAGFHLS